MMLQQEQVRKLLGRQMGMLAKSDGTPLWSHHYAAWWIMRHLCQYLPSLDEKEKEGLELAALLHDVGKMRPEVQAYLHNPKPGGPPHKPMREEIQQELSLSGLWDAIQVEEFTDFAHGVTVGHHYLADRDVREMKLNSADSLVRLLITADHLASMTRADRQTIREINSHFSFFDLSLVEISRFPSPTSFLLQQHIREAFEANGWSLLLAYAEGQVFIGPSGGKLPDKQDLVDSVHSDFLEQLLNMQSPNPANFTNAMLAGPALDYPDKFFKVYRDRIEENLNDEQKAPFWFLKPIIDLLARTDEFNEWSARHPILKILRGSCSTSSLSKAKEEWMKYSGIQTKADRQGHLVEMFERVALQEILPEALRGDAPSATPLANLYPDDLLQVLEKVFSCEEVLKQCPQDTLREQLDELLTMEEDRDFQAFAQLRFQRYKEYKRTANYHKGLCERCGSPAAQPVKPALNYPSDVKTKVFTQIKPSSQKETATCTLCVYDNSIMRQDAKGSYSPVLLRIRCLYPRDPDEIGALADFIEEIWRGVLYPHQIEQRHPDHLLPDQMWLPIPSEKKKPRNNRFKFMPHESHPTVLMGILETAPREGPQELKAKYAPLYHLLNLMGFITDIGLEEQSGLLGEQAVSTIESYTRSLGVIVLAKALSDKKKKSYTAAADLLSNSLSVAITMICEGNYITVSMQRCFFNAIKNQPLIKGKEDWTVKDLLKDAAFLADREKGIWFFCVEYEEKSGEISKHLATKPIAQAMNILLRSRDPDESLPLAIATFDSHLRRNIPKEKNDELAAFTQGAHAILRKYAQLRKENFQQFLKIRNALMSAIFTFTRYPQLSKENV